MADGTRKVLRLNRVTGDGTKTPGTITLVLKDPVSGDELRNADGTPAVTMTLKPMDEEERHAILAEFTRLEKDPGGGRGLYEFIDSSKANDEILVRSIETWDGIVGSDDKPLVVTRATKLVLDGYIRAQVTKKLFGSEVVEVLAASFR